MNEAIFIFTKNRHELLKKLIDQFSFSSFKIFIIDDSSETYIQNLNQNLCADLNIIYFGKAKQRTLVNLINLKGLKSSYFLKVLGDGDWNLGYARNYALLISAIYKIEKLIFLDDDINIELKTICWLFKGLDKNDVVGSKVVGMPDNSILGHYAEKLGLHEKKLYSGGCLGINVFSVKNHFLNLYNEDWIWQIFQGSGYGKEIGEVEQQLYNPLENWKEKIFFQEIGEVIVDAIKTAKKKTFLETKKKTFWDRKIRARKKYLMYLYEKSHIEAPHFLVIAWLLQNYSQVTKFKFHKTFKTFLKGRKVFQKMYNQLLVEDIKLL